MRLKCLILFICLIAVFEKINAQDEVKSYVDTTRALKDFKASEEATKKILLKYDGNHKKEFTEELKSSEDYLKYLYKKIYYHDESNAYLNQIVDLIKTSNPDTKDLDIRTHFLYDEVTNAFMVFEGSMFVNLGIFEIVENESQLAMILAHEISHFSKEHSYLALKHHFEDYYSEENVAKRKEARKEGIDRVEKITQVYKNLSMNSKQHVRDHEEEADSSALTYLKNTPYSLVEAIGGVKILKECDTEKFIMFDLLKNTFTFDDLQFKEDWVKKPTSLGDKLRYRLTDSQRDSIRTHPKTDERYDSLYQAILPIKEADILELNPDMFDKLKKDFRLQIVEYLIRNKEYSLAMYKVLKYQHEGDNREFLKKKMLDLLTKMHKALDEHELGKFVEVRNPFYPPQYNNLLIFLDKLTVEDLEGLKKNYKTKHNL